MEKLDNGYWLAVNKDDSEDNQIIEIRGDTVLVMGRISSEREFNNHSFYKVEVW